MLHIRLENEELQTFRELKLEENDMLAYHYLAMFRVGNLDGTDIRTTERYYNCEEEFPPRGHDGDVRDMLQQFKSAEGFRIVKNEGDYHYKEVV